jgi:hypothetical protein
LCRKVPKSKQLQGSQSLLQAMPRGNQPLVQGAHVSAIKPANSPKFCRSNHYIPTHHKQLSHSLSPFHRSNATKITKNSQEHSRTHLNIHPTTVTKLSQSITQRTNPNSHNITVQIQGRIHAEQRTHQAEKRILAQLITSLQRICKVLRDSVRIIIIEPNPLQSELRFTTKAAKN